MKTEFKEPAVNERIIIIDEPKLEFADGQTAEDPHDGLALFGPLSQGSASHPQSPNHVVLACPDGFTDWQQWSQQLNRAAAVAEAKKHTLWPPYPGFDVAFGSVWPERALKEFTLDKGKLLDASRLRDPHERCFAVVEQFLSCFEACRKLDEKVSVAVCVIPDELWQNCRPESKVADPIGPRLSTAEKAGRKAGQLSMFESFNAEQYSLSPDFRRQLKARSMRFDIPLQIVRQSTLRPHDNAKFGRARPHAPF